MSSDSADTERFRTSILRLIAIFLETLQLSLVVFSQLFLWLLMVLSKTVVIEQSSMDNLNKSLADRLSEINKK